MKQQELSVLSNVIAVARRELADRDDKEIPARLVRVAKSAARKLPPPFSVSLINELRSNAPFRESVLERWESSDMSDPVGEAFLRDPDAGVGQVIEQAESRAAASIEADLVRAEHAITTLENKLDEARKRLVEARDTHRVELARQQAGAVASRESLEKAVRSLTADTRRLEEICGGHAHEVASHVQEMEDLRGKLERSTERARKRAQKDHVRVRHQMAPPSDPQDLAAWLDSVERQQRGFREAYRADADMAGIGHTLRIPDGLLPDSHEALTSLIAQRPDVIYVDGYNVAAMLVADFSTTGARARVTAIADRLAAASRARVVVVFDAVGVDGRPSTSSQGRAEVRFTQAQIADDEIVELVAANPLRAVVISSDRELSNRLQAQGCVTVWSEALVRWAGR